MCMGHCDYPTNFASAKLAFETDCQEECSLVRQPSPIQWNLHNTNTVGTTSNCPYYRGVPTSEFSSIFPVGMAMRTCAVEHFEGVFHSSPLLYNGKKG